MMFAEKLIFFNSREKLNRFYVSTGLAIGTSIVISFVVVIVIQGQFSQLINFVHYGESAINRKRTTKELSSFRWSKEIQQWTLSRESTGKEDIKGIELSGSNCIWPEDCKDYKLDRIVNQLKWKPQQVVGRTLKIFPPDFTFPIGNEVFKKENCLVNKCSLTFDSDEADALVFANSDVSKEIANKRKIDQVWIAYFLESPVHTFDKRFARLYRGKHEFNLTASYRSDSDIVTPYSKFVPYKNKVNEFGSLLNGSQKPEIDAERLLGDKHKSLIGGKEGKVAWFVSNCHANNKRLEYAKELSQYIQVDIYGRCGNLTCEKRNQSGCIDVIKKNYKFYLAFENSNCREYMTEKLYLNALGYNDPDYLVLPIVMGPPKEDLSRFAPPSSFIHVDDFESPKELAEFLHHLDANDVDLYSYFRWKTLGEFIDTKFLCRLCAMLHDYFASNKSQSYRNIQDWWNSYEGIGACER